MSYVSNPFTAAAAATWKEKKQINKRQDVDYKQTLGMSDVASFGQTMESSWSETFSS